MKLFRVATAAVFLTGGCASDPSDGVLSRIFPYDRDIEAKELNPVAPDKNYEYQVQLAADADRVCAAPLGLLNEGRRFSSEYDRFMHAAYCAYHYSALVNTKGAPNRTVIKEHYVRLYIDYGVSLSDELCDDWLNKLEVKRTRTEFIQNNVAIGTQATTAIMAIAESSKKSLGVFAVLGSAIASGFENYKQSFILTPNLQSLKKQIFSLRDQKKALFTEKNLKDFTYSDAEQALDAYDETCSRKFVVDILNTSLNEIKYSFTIPDFSPIQKVVTERDGEEIDVSSLKTMLKTEQFKAINLKEEPNNGQN